MRKVHRIQLRNNVVLSIQANGFLIYLGIQIQLRIGFFTII